MTSDLGTTWKEHPTSHAVLTEPTCMASVHKHVYRAEDGSRKTLLAFFNPDSYQSRDHLTLKLSFDNGMTWPEKYWLTLDDWGVSGTHALLPLMKIRWESFMKEAGLS